MKEGEVITEGPWRGFKVISVYSRAMAIKEGVLIDVTDVAGEAGIRYPVAVTSTVYNGYIEPDEKAKEQGQDLQGRLWDTVWMLRCAISASEPGQREVYYRLFYSLRGRRRLVTLKAVCGPGDDGEPVITIMRPEED